MFTLLDEQKARKFWEEELKQEGRAEGRVEGRAEGQIAALAGLVRKGLITLSDAAQEANLSVNEFALKAGIPFPN